MMLEIWDFGEITDTFKKSKFEFNSDINNVKEIIEYFSINEFNGLGISRKNESFKDYLINEGKLKSFVNIYDGTDVNLTPKRLTDKIPEHIIISIFNTYELIKELNRIITIRNTISKTSKQNTSLDIEKIDLESFDNLCEYQHEPKNGLPIEQLDIHDLLKNVLFEQSWKKLRKFQEDFLNNVKNSDKKTANILSMPTGAGKTEAFLLPVLDSIINTKFSGLNSDNSVKSVFFYPTKALGNDQTLRIVDFIEKINKNLPLHLKDRKITIGIFTGDTKKRPYFELDNSVLNACSCGSSKIKIIKKDNSPICYQCEDCNNIIDFLFENKEDILSYKPDFLITTPDKINSLLSSPKERNLLSNQLDYLIFDELHNYKGVFGTNVAFLISRLEKSYTTLFNCIGVTATIGNAEEIAKKLFNKTKINYINYETKYDFYFHETVSRKRIHVPIRPKQENSRVTTSTSPVQVLLILQHLIKDPHFRKTLVFGEFVKNTEKMSTELKNEDRQYWSDHIINNMSEFLERYNSSEKLLQHIEQSILKFSWVLKEGINISYRLNLSNITLKIGTHRGGLEPKKVMNDIKKYSVIDPSNNPKDIVFNTKTLELGLDLGDTSVVFNAPTPLSVNSYKQRVGRAGRKYDSIVFTLFPPDSVLSDYYYKNFHNLIPRATISKEEKELNIESIPLSLKNEQLLTKSLKTSLLDFIAIHIDLENNKKYLNGNVVQLFRETFNNNMDLFKRKFKEYLNSNSENNYFNSIIELQFDIILNEFRTDLNIIENDDSLLTEEMFDYFNQSNSEKHPFSKYLVDLRASFESIPVIISNDNEERISIIKSIREFVKGTMYSTGGYSFKIKDVVMSNKFTYDLLENKPQEKLKNFLKKVNIEKHQIFQPAKIFVERWPKVFFCDQCKKIYNVKADYKFKELSKNNFLCSECKIPLVQVTDIMYCTERMHIGDAVVPFPEKCDVCGTPWVYKGYGRWYCSKCNDYYKKYKRYCSKCKDIEGFRNSENKAIKLTSGKIPKTQVELHTLISPVRDLDLIFENFNLFKEISFGEITVIQIATKWHYKLWDKSSDRYLLSEREYKLEENGKDSGVIYDFKTKGLLFKLDVELINSFLEDKTLDNYSDKETNFNYEVEEYESKEILRRILIHSILHLFTSVSPKFSGVEKTEISIHPDYNNYSFYLFDNAIGGNGSTELLKNDFKDKWYPQTLHALKSAEQVVSLVLPMACAEWDNNLSLKILKDFFEFIET